MARSIVQVLLLFFLAVIGVNWPELPFNARLPDLIFVPLAIAVLALGAPRMIWRRSDLAVAIYLLGALPAIAVSADPRHSSMEFAREVYLAAVYVIVAIAARQGFARVTGLGLALAGAIPAVAGLLYFVVLLLTGASPWQPIGEVMVLPYLGNTLRLRALAATPAMFACVLTAAVPVAITRCGIDRARVWCGLSVVMLIAAALTFSHIIAGLAVAVVIAAWPACAAWPRLRRLAIAGIAVLVLVMNFAATISITSIAYGDVGFADSSQYQYAVEEGHAQFGAARITYNVMSYARIKQVALRTFVEHPVAGIGLDQFHVATRRAYAEGALPSSYQEIDPHSTLIGRLAECGVIGGAALLLLWIAWAAMAKEVAFGSGRVPLALAAAAALAGLIVAGVNADIMNFRFVWVLAGLLRGLQDTNGMVTGDPNASTPLNDQGQAPR
jgi:hypothetical protein